MIKKSEAIEAVCTLKKWCTGRSCGNCVFYEPHVARCAMGNRSPSRWALPVLRRWSEAEIELAKALKLCGYTGVRRQTDGALVVEKGDLLWYYLPPKFAFDGLRPGDSSSLDDIIGEAENGSC